MLFNFAIQFKYIHNVYYTFMNMIKPGIYEPAWNMGNETEGTWDIVNLKTGLQISPDQTSGLTILLLYGYYRPPYLVGNQRQSNDKIQ